MASAKQKTRRQKDLAKIHIAKKQLGLNDEVYRDMLFVVAGVRSAADLDAHARLAVLGHLKNAGFKIKGRKTAGFPGRPKQSFFEDPDVGKMLGKIEAMLAEAGRPWKYVHRMAQRMHGVDRVEWCGQRQIHKIVSALVYDAKRHGRL